MYQSSDHSDRFLTQPFQLQAIYLQARKKYDHRLLQDLATGGTVIESAEHAEDGRALGDFMPGKLVIALAVVLMLSLLGNAILMALLSGR